MSQVIKTYLGIFLIFAMTSLSILILRAFLVTSEAIHLHTQIIAEMEESNFAAPVIASCFEEAEENGFSLTVKIYREDQSTVLYSTGEAAEGLSESGITMAKVQLSYSLALMGESGEAVHTVSGYAR